MLPVPVDEVLGLYLASVDADRPGLIEGLYLVGSVALDDFQAGASDVDAIFVVAEPPTRRQPGSCGPRTSHALARTCPPSTART